MEYTVSERKELPKKTDWMPAFLAPRSTGSVWMSYYETGLHAQIDALEELITHMRARFTSASNPTGSYCNEESLWISEKIAALRKELGE